MMYVFIYTHIVHDAHASRRTHTTVASINAPQGTVHGAGPVPPLNSHIQPTAKPAAPTRPASPDRRRRALLLGSTKGSYQERLRTPPPRAHGRRARASPLDPAATPAHPRASVSPTRDAAPRIELAAPWPRGGGHHGMTGGGGPGRPGKGRRVCLPRVGGARGNGWKGQLCRRDAKRQKPGDGDSRGSGRLRTRLGE